MINDLVIGQEYEWPWRKGGQGLPCIWSNGFDHVMMNRSEKIIDGLIRMNKPK